MFSLPSCIHLTWFLMKPAENREETEVKVRIDATGAHGLLTTKKWLNFGSPKILLKPSCEVLRVCSDGLMK